MEDLFGIVIEQRERREQVRATEAESLIDLIEVHKPRFGGAFLSTKLKMGRSM